MINSELDKLKSHTNAIGEICLRKDNVLTFTPNKVAKKTSIDILKKDLVIYMEWTKPTGPLPFLSDNRTLKQMSAEERIYIQSKVPLFASKLAILVSSGLSTFFFNIMSYLNPPEIPMKAFSDVDKAFEWLKKNK